VLERKYIHSIQLKNLFEDISCLYGHLLLSFIFTYIFQMVECNDWHDRRWCLLIRCMYYAYRRMNLKLTIQNLIFHFASFFTYFVQRQGDIQTHRLMMRF